MPLERWSQQIVVVHLGDDPQFTEDLRAAGALLTGERGDVVLDFSAVQAVNSSNLSLMLRLRKAMNESDARLILCGMSTQVWGTFLVTGLDKIFQFSDNVPTALATLQIAQGSA